MIPLSESLAEMKKTMHVDRERRVAAQRQLKAAIEEQLRITGTADPVVRLSPEDYAAYEYAREHVSTFEGWLRMEAWDRGLRLMPRFERVDS